MKNKDLIIESLETLLSKSSEITKFYSKVIDSNATFLHVHGIKASKEEIKTGQRFRDEFNALIDKHKLLLKESKEQPEPINSPLTEEEIDLRGELIEFYLWYDRHIAEIEKYSHDAIDVIDKYLTNSK